MNKYLYLIFSLVLAFATFSGVIRIPSFIYLGGVVLFFLFLIINGSPVKINSFCILLFWCVCLLSILINTPAAYFNAPQRVLTFLLVLLSFSPLIKSNYINGARLNLYDSLLKVAQIFTIGSFVGYFFGINYFVWKDIELDMNDFGHFSGLTNHSMVLGPISALSSVYTLSRFFESNVKRTKTILLLFTIFSFCTVLMSSSRGAVVASIAGILTIVYKRAKSKSRTIKYLFGLVFVVLITFPLWSLFALGVTQKNEANIDRGGMMSSREGKLLFRMYEIENNFFTGVGFATVDPSIDVVDKDTGHVEPSIGWLAVFSMTGVFGFTLFVYMFFKYLRIALKKIPDSYYSNLLCGVLVFFGFHMLVEGYVLSAGNILCGLFWLTLGAIEAKSNEICI